MKLIFAVLYVSRTMGLTLVIKRKFFNIYFIFYLIGEHYNDMTNMTLTCGMSR